MQKWILEENSISCKGSGKSLLRNAPHGSDALHKKNDVESIHEERNQKIEQKQKAQTELTAKQKGLSPPQPQPKENQGPDIKASEKPTSSPLTLSQHSCNLEKIKPQHAKPRFLYEHYPLKPSLLYGSPASNLRDRLKRLDQISYLSQNSWHSISATLPTCQCALVKPQFNPSDNLQISQHSRLESGAEERNSVNAIIADVAGKTRNTYKGGGKSVESICSTCRRNAFFVPRNTQLAMNARIGFEDVETTKDSNTSTVSTNYNNLHSKDSSSVDKQTNLQYQDSILLFEKHYRGPSQKVKDSKESNEEASLGLAQSTEVAEKSASEQATVPTNSLVSDYVVSVPIFEVLTKNDTYNYTNRLALKHKDSLLFYANLKRIRRKSCTVKTLEIRQRKLSSFVRFSDELNLVCKPSDENVVFGSARRLNYKFHRWEESRIAWLAELERRQEVRRRRKRRSENRKAKQTASESAWWQCSFLCERIRWWLAKWRL